MEALRQHLCNLIAVRNKISQQELDDSTFDGALWWLNKEIKEARLEMDALLRQAAA